jgi:hypothetical protein
MTRLEPSSTCDSCGGIDADPLTVLPQELRYNHACECGRQGGRTMHHDHTIDGTDAMVGHTILSVRHSPGTLPILRFDCGWVSSCRSVDGGWKRGEEEVAWLRAQVATAEEQLELDKIDLGVAQDALDTFEDAVNGQENTDDE